MPSFKLEIFGVCGLSILSPKFISQCFMRNAEERTRLAQEREISSSHCKMKKSTPLSIGIQHHFKLFEKKVNHVRRKYALSVPLSVHKKSDDQIQFDVLSAASAALSANIALFRAAQY